MSSLRYSSDICGETVPLFGFVSRINVTTMSFGLPMEPLPSL